MHKNIVINIFYTFLIKGGGLLLSFFTLPAYINYFNNQTQLGLWFTVLSVLTWILTFDFGIGNGLRNHLTAVIAEFDNVKIRKYISTAYISVFFIVIIIIFIFCLMFNFINWYSLFNTDSLVISLNALKITVFITFIGIMLQIFLNLIFSVFYAMQKSALNNLPSLCTSIIILLFALFMPSKDNDTNMITMAIVHSLAVIIPLLSAAFIVFNTALKKSKPSFKYFNLTALKKIFGLGSIFFFVQIVYMIIMSTNEYLINTFYFSQAVVEYRIYYKIFTPCTAAFALALTPIWSAVTKAFAQKDISTIKKLYNKLLIFGALGCIAEFLLIPFLQLFVNLWLKENAIQINYFYCIIFALLGSFIIINCVLSSISNGMGKLKTQAVLFSIGAIIKIPLSYILINVLNSWIGVVIANIAGICIYCIIQPFVFKKSAYFYFSN